MVDTKKRTKKKRKKSTSTTTTTTSTCLPTNKKNPLIITSEKIRGIYECDYCKTDISQTPRIRCAICPDFDLCLECFATTDVCAIAAGIRAGLDASAAVVELEGLENAVAIANANAAAAGGNGDGRNANNNNNNRLAEGKNATGLFGGKDKMEQEEPKPIHDETHGYRVSDSTRFVLFPSVRGVSSLKKYQLLLKKQLLLQEGNDLNTTATAATATTTVTATATTGDKMIPSGTPGSPIKTADTSTIVDVSNAATSATATIDRSATVTATSTAFETITTEEKPTDAKEKVQSSVDAATDGGGGGNVVDMEVDPPSQPLVIAATTTITNDSSTVQNQESVQESKSTTNNTTTNTMTEDTIEKVETGNNNDGTTLSTTAPTISIKLQEDTKEEKSTANGNDEKDEESKNVAMEKCTTNEHDVGLSTTTSTTTVNESSKEEKDDSIDSIAAVVVVVEDEKDSNNSKQDASSTITATTSTTATSQQASEIPKEDAPADTNTLDSKKEIANEKENSSSQQEQQATKDESATTKEGSGSSTTTTTQEPSKQSSINEEPTPEPTSNLHFIMQGGQDTLASISTPKILTMSTTTNDNDDDDDAGRGDELVVTDDPGTMWTAEEDLRLLHGIKTCGLGNWADIAEVVAGASATITKSAKRCMERYFDDFLNRYGCIVPEYTLVESEGDRSESNVLFETPLKPLQQQVVIDADGGIHSSRKRKRSERVIQQQNSTNAMSDVNINAQYDVVPTSTLVDLDEAWPEAYVPPIGVKMGDEVGRDYCYKAEEAYVKLLSTASTKEQGEKIRKEWLENHKNDKFQPSVLPPRLEDMNDLPGAELAGYMQRRGDFDIEWENDAEGMLAEMDFLASDSPEQRDLKIRVIEIYNSKLDERVRRKKFLKDYGLLDYRKLQAENQSRPSDERDLVNRMRLFARFHTPEQHKKFVNNLLEAKRLRKEIARLQTYRRMGIRSMAEAERFELDRNRREIHKVALNKQKEMADKALAASDAEERALSPGEGMESSYGKYYKNSDRKSRKSINRSHDTLFHPDVMNQGSAVQQAIINTSKTESFNAGQLQGHTTDDKGETKPMEKKDIEESKLISEGVPDSSQIDSSGRKDEVMVDEEKTSQGQNETMDVDDGTFKISKYPGYELLSSKEVMLCESLQLLPEYYLEAKKTLIRESFHRGMLEAEGANSNHQLIAMIDVTKRKNVVEFVLKSGWI